MLLKSQEVLFFTIQYIAVKNFHFLKIMLLYI
ncbi:hypothetical protein L414_02823 [Enterobacter hormaechei subsp. hoffmannii UCICRE 3]|nr:hypothetical protein L414_02823 [Enterobacter hormaechei subsp. hoffmannii UCICRE 3]EUL37458.1 hypothetical protein P853_00699 [Enterobacter hormaechei subsp. hoffmannii UCI 50]KLW33309.1 hypothetical protein SK51_02806 [Enterobacter sp. MGH85]CAF3237237.1 hypothetical protein AI3013V2_2450 [Enterobacter cloacae]CZV50768.1 Uncharacterised protein [Enterobacter hormaechei]